MRVLFQIIFFVAAIVHLRPAKAAALQKSYSFKLNSDDSTDFSEGMKGLSEVKEARDPEFTELLHAKEWYQSKNGAITISCRRTYIGEEQSLFNAECDFDFEIQEFSSDVDSDVTVSDGGVVRAIIRDADAATKIYRNFGMNTYTSNEQVGYMAAGVLQERPRVRLECTPVNIMEDLARQCIVEVVVDSE